MRRRTRSLTPFALLVLCCAAPAVGADPGDETLEAWRRASDLVVSGVISEVRGPFAAEAGVAHYGVTVQAPQVLKGHLPEDTTHFQARVVRLESDRSDPLPFLAKGNGVVLFLRALPPGNRPSHMTSDLWFAVQPYSAALIRSLERLERAAEAARAEEEVVFVAQARTDAKDALERVDRLLSAQGLSPALLTSGDWVYASLPASQAERARALLRDARQAAGTDAGGRPPAGYEFTVIEAGADASAAEWVQEHLAAFAWLEPGRTRADVEARYPMDGGLHGLTVRFTHPTCAWLKVDVTFDVTEGPEGRAVFAPTDPVKTVSKPYLERPNGD